MSDDFGDSFIAARTMRNTADIAQELRNINNELRAMRQDMVSVDKWNDLVKKYNCDTSRFYAQSEEAMAIIKENIEILPFEYEEACDRVNKKGDEAFNAEAQNRS